MLRIAYFLTDIKKPFVSNILVEQLCAGPVSELSVLLAQCILAISWDIVVRGFSSEATNRLPVQDFKAKPSLL